MANPTYRQSVPSLGTSGTLPSNAGNVISCNEWGIDNTLSDCIIQEESITEQVISDTTQDQKGAVVSELDYDRQWNLTLTLLCDAKKAPVTGSSEAFAVGDTTFTYPQTATTAGGQPQNWKLDSVEYTGSYNSKKQYRVTAHRYWNFPAQPKTETGTGS